MVREVLDDTQNQLQPTRMNFIPFKEVCKMSGRGHSSLDGDVKAGVFTSPVKPGGKLKTWPDYEVDIQIAADIAGKSKEEKRTLVQQLMAARTEHFDSLINQFKSLTSQFKTAA